MDTFCSGWRGEWCFKVSSRGRVQGTHHPQKTDLFTALPILTRSPRPLSDLMYLPDGTLLRQLKDTGGGRARAREGVRKRGSEGEKRETARKRTGICTLIALLNATSSCPHPRLRPHPRLLHLQAAGFTTRLLTSPLDVVKIRAQLQVEAVGAPDAKYRGVVHTFKTIMREEGQSNDASSPFYNRHSAPLSVPVCL